MPIVFAAVVPHSPLLVPGVAKEHQRLIDGTRQAIERLVADYYAAQPDVVVILSPHGPAVPNSFVAQQSDKLIGRLKDFGDVQTIFRAPGAVGIAHQFKELAEDRNLSLILQSAPEVDYGITVPGIFFSQTGSPKPVLAINVANQESVEIIRLGQLLYEFAHSTNQRLALLASADLTRREQPEKFGSISRPTSEEKHVAEAISSVDPAQLDPGVHTTPTCGIDPILCLLSCLQPLHAHGTVMSFEAPFGVGLLTASFNLHT